MDLNNLNERQLTSLKNDVEAALKTVEERRRKAALLDMEKIAKEHGFTVDQLVDTQGVKKGKSGKVPLPPKYAHPDNPNLTWSGRGRQPDWIRELIENGGDKEAYSI